MVSNGKKITPPATKYFFCPYFPLLKQSLCRDNSY
ncbi:MAG: hypothetical protein ACI9JY_001598, partial [Saprospiraceae bacterium]